MAHAGWTRRGLLASAGALALSRLAPAQDPQTKPAAEPNSAAPKKPLFELSLSQWSLHRALEQQRLDNLDFPVVARKDYDIGSSSSTPSSRTRRRISPT